MSDSPRTVAKSKSGRVLPRRIFDDILALANSLLEDECPIADFEDWLFPIDDTLLELKLWAKTVGVEQGLLEKVVRYEDLCLVVGRILHDVITPLQDIKKMCENPKILTSPEVRATYVHHELHEESRRLDSRGVPYLPCIPGSPRLLINFNLLPVSSWIR